MLSKVLVRDIGEDFAMCMSVLCLSLSSDDITGLQRFAGSLLQTF